MQPINPELCPDDHMTDMVAKVQADDDDGLAYIETLLVAYPADPRLHFLKGSVLAGTQRYHEGRQAMYEAIAIAPEFDLARFQLGFLEFTSGMVAEAIQTWTPFDMLGEFEPFRLFASGLAYLSQDNFAECDRLLRLGVEYNKDHPLINGDMQLILNEITSQLKAVDMPDTIEPVSASASAAHQLLQQFELMGSTHKTKH
jgi:tetratricopeptide (TPR) repeat protein